MDPEYGTKRRAVPLLVEDVAGSQTSVKVEEIGAKVDKLASIIESTVPRGCYSHWRIVNKTTGELINQGMLNDTSIGIGELGLFISAIVIKVQPGGYGVARAYFHLSASGDVPDDANVVFWIPKVNPDNQKVELYNPYDTTVDVYEVSSRYFESLRGPVYLKHLPPYPSNAKPTSYLYYPNGKDVYTLNKTMGTESSAEDSNTVVGLLKSISNKL